MSNVPAKCKGFKCKPGATDCCCRRILYNQPDFASVTSVLEAVCIARGVEVRFLLNFHCELNFIEKCWGRAKFFFTRSLRFMDAYHRGLNGRQAAWATRKYRGHRVLPNSIMEDLEEEGIL
ncbi:hypothetical protein BDN70DRAFT_907465 [Pholiota conissans]|uniref:Uncharacterized protein n=1 Tax=Pholiota conissans TaxID=109636 RepID=A0A9P5YZC5_9AGAR|nr:hypothetical protein BDN70DRAFT_907465 [Pholiota conissans]